MAGNPPEEIPDREAVELDNICNDIAALGYNVQPVSIPACAAGAPHVRERIFIIGHTEHPRRHASEDPEGHRSRGARKPAGADELLEPPRPDSLRETLPTPLSFGEKNKGKMNGGDRLSQALSLLPTPRTRDWKGETQRGAYRPKDGLPNAIKYRRGAKTGLRLQPAFVEWMMGFPSGWTNLNSPPQSTASKE